MAPPNPLSGHLGHLTAAQEQAFAKFKELCVAENLYTPAGEGGKEASHDDATMLRFLRARRFDPTAALGQFRDTEAWRAANDIDGLYDHFDVSSYQEARQYYPQWVGRRDRRGVPLYVYKIRDLDSANMSSYHASLQSEPTSTQHAASTIPPKLLRIFALYENMRRFALPLCTALTASRPNPETPISAAATIADVQGVGLKQFWNLKGHMQEPSTLSTAHYPETLDRIYIVGAPFFFPTVWGWIKNWFDPVTTSKIEVLSAVNMKAALTAHIAPENLPKRYGGELDWDFGQAPLLDDETRDLVGEIGDVPGPIVFDPKTGEVTAVGTVDGKPRREVVGKKAAVAPKADESDALKEKAQMDVDVADKEAEPVGAA